MVNPNHDTINVEAAERDPDSVLHFYRELLRLRGGSETLIYGSFALNERERMHPQVFSYWRRLGNESYAIVCNMSGAEAALSGLPAGECVLSNVMDHEGSVLQPYEARVYRHIRNAK